jgi:predicted site-specific integrase-resolvase
MFADNEMGPAVTGRLLVTETEAAHVLHVSISTFRRDVLGKGYIKPVDLPGGTRRNLYKLETLERLVNEAEERSLAADKA